MPPTDLASLVASYEALRAAFLASRTSPATRLGIQRMIAQGLHAWLTSRAPACPCKAQQVPYSPPITAAVPGNEALVHLIAAMTLQSLAFSEEAA